jgi:hypothetical protein
MGLVFCDLETTGLADDCDIWEIGLIQRLSNDDEHEDLEYRWLIRPDLTTAEPTGLRIGRYYDRIGILTLAAPGNGRCVDHPDPSMRTARSTATIAAEVATLLDGNTIVGAVPDFDARHLTRWLRTNGQAATWHYHLVDVETFAAGALRLPPPWNFDKLLGEFGLAYDEADRHTALGDARLVRDLYDAVLSGREVAS